MHGCSEMVDPCQIIMIPPKKGLFSDRLPHLCSRSVKKRGLGVEHAADKGHVQPGLALTLQLLACSSSLGLHRRSIHGVCWSN